MGAALVRLGTFIMSRYCKAKMKDNKKDLTDIFDKEETKKFRCMRKPMIGSDEDDIFDKKLRIRRRRM